MEEKFIVAVEIGSSKIKGALAMIEPSGLLNLLAVQEETLVDAVRYGQIKNVEEVSKRIDAIRAKLEASKPVLGRSINGVYVGLSGLSVGSKIADVELNFQVETGITDLTIDELKRRASEAAPAGRDLYAVMPVEFIVDNMSMPNPVGSYGKNIRARFLILSGAPGIKSNINRVFPERLKLDIRGYIVSAAAVADAVLTDDERRLGAVFVDFGAETTTVAIYKEGAMRYLATLPMGSRNITRDLMSLSHLEERAEEIKRVNGVTSTTVDGPRISCAPDIIDQPEINQCIHARACEIIANIMAQIEYAGFRQADLPAGIVIAGGGARMKGFSDLLASRGNIKARPAVAPRDIRLTDASILADDAVDVIALLLHAAKAPQDCVTSAPDISASPEADSRPDRQSDDDRQADRYRRDPDHDRRRPRRRGRDDDYDPYDDGVRIGRQDDDDDDILADDPDDKHSRRDRRPRRRDDFDDDDDRFDDDGRFDDDDDDPKRKERQKGPKKTGIFTAIGARIRRIMDDESDDFNEN